jgi:hypothetical protein
MLAKTAATKILKHNARTNVFLLKSLHTAHTLSRSFFKRSLSLSLNGRAETDHTGHQSLKMCRLFNWVRQIQAKSFK